LVEAEAGRVVIRKVAAPDAVNYGRIAGIAIEDAPEVIHELLLYMQQLRDFPKRCDPQNPIWPKWPQTIK
jgi:hypothetical protein